MGPDGEPEGGAAARRLQPHAASANPTRTWQRTNDFDSAADVFGRCEMVVTADATLGGTRWRLIGSGGIAVGTAPIAFRITKPAASQSTVGALVFNYFPYLGT